MNKNQLIKEYKEIEKEQYENFKLIEEKSKVISNAIFLSFFGAFSLMPIFSDLEGKDVSSVLIIESVSILILVSCLLSLLYNFYKYKTNKKKYKESENKTSIYFENKRMKLMKKIVNNKKMLLEFKNIDEEELEMFNCLNTFIKERRSKTLIEYIEEINKKELKNINIV